MVQKIVTGILAVLFLGVMFGGMFHVTTKMGGAEHDCPIMIGGGAVCSMTALDHAAMWKSLFVSIVPMIALLLLSLGGVWLLTRAPNLWMQLFHSPPLPPRDVVERVYSFSYRQFQELFSSGILHPKLF